MIDKIKERSKYAEAVAPVLQRGASLSRGDLGARSQIFGTTPDYLKTTNYGVAVGRFFTKGEDRSGARVALLGHDVAENLFPNQDPIGKYFKIDGIRFKALGVMEKQGKFLGLFSFDTQVIIPSGTSQRLFSKRGFLRISVKVPEDKSAEPSVTVVDNVKLDCNRLTPVMLPLEIVAIPSVKVLEDIISEPVKFPFDIVVIPSVSFVAVIVPVVILFTFISFTEISFRFDKVPLANIAVPSVSVLLCA